MYTPLAYAVETVPLDVDAATRVALANLGISGPRDYLIALTDLNGDGVADAVVLVRDELWCAPNGCLIAVLEGSRDGRFGARAWTVGANEPVGELVESSHKWCLITYRNSKRGLMAMSLDSPSRLGWPDVDRVLAHGESARVRPLQMRAPVRSIEGVAPNNAFERTGEPSARLKARRPAAQRER